MFFREAAKFIEAHRDEPFFVYLATNAPHSPYRVAEEWKAPYLSQVGDDKELAAYYGMIANIDENLGRTRRLHGVDRAQEILALRGGDLIFDLYQHRAVVGKRLDGDVLLDARDPAQLLGDDERLHRPARVEGGVVVVAILALVAGVVPAGDPFPTDHLCAPAHEGCRCMLALAPR